MTIPHRDQLIRTASFLTLLLLLTGCRLVPLRVPSPVSKGAFDFGDAPDGAPTNYDTGSTTGHFPSKLASNGARTRDTSQVWLGDAVDQETDSKQVNQDAGDDGVRTNFHSCDTSQATFYVHVANPGAMTGTAYLNLFVDWNRDGQWAGRDDCADEWAVKNQPVDLGQQTTPIAIVTSTFTGGKLTNNLWYRSTVTLNEPMAGDTKGVYQAGEVEDYGPGAPGDPAFYDAFCNPDPLKINHGDKGTVQVTRSLWSTADLTDLDFPNSFKPKDDNREITIDHLNRTFTYRSKKIDPPERTVADPVKIKAKFGDKAIIDITCWVEIKHTGKEPPPTITTPLPTTQPAPEKTTPTTTPSTTSPTQPTQTQTQGTMGGTTGTPSTLGY